MITRVPAALMLAGVLMAGCGGGSGSSATATPTASGADGARLSSIVVQQSDLPAGWAAKPFVPNPASSAQQAAVLTCAGAPDTSVDKTGEAHSANFTSGNSQVSAHAASYAQASDVAAQVALIQSPAISDCYGELLRSQIAGSGTEVDGVSVVVTPGNGPGPTNIIGTATGTAHITSKGQPTTFYLSAAFITGPMTVAEVDAESVGAPIDPNVLASLYIAVATRANTP
jgi:hypothetical protein